MSGFAITFVGVLQVLGIFAAFQLGRQIATEKSKWPKGSMLEGGWQAWRTPYIILVAVAAGITIFLPVLSGGPGGGGGLFSGLLGGGFGGGFGGRGGVGGRRTTVYD